LSWGGCGGESIDFLTPPFHFTCTTTAGCRRRNRSRGPAHPPVRCRLAAPLRRRNRRPRGTSALGAAVVSGTPTSASSGTSTRRSTRLLHSWERCFCSPLSAWVRVACLPTAFFGGALCLLNLLFKPLKFRVFVWTHLLLGAGRGAEAAGRVAPRLSWPFASATSSGCSGASVSGGDIARRSSFGSRRASPHASADKIGCHGAGVGCKGARAEALQEPACLHRGPRCLRSLGHGAPSSLGD
jgi:hypothetical protein